MKIKVCGMRDGRNISEIAALQPDYMGFIFYQPSSRYVGELNAALLAALPETTARVGVFVNHDEAFISSMIETYSLNALQLHGNEAPEFCGRFRPIPVIKAFSVGETFDFAVLEAYKPYCNYFLFDTKGRYHGGNGQTFDWKLLDAYDNEKPIFLSGGIDLEHTEAIRQLNHLNIHAIDINSRFELSPGLKDVHKIKQFIHLLAASNNRAI